MEDNKKLADKEKDLGNDALNKGDFNEAIKHYTKGIELDPNNQVLYSNRSAAYTKLQKYDEAVADGDKAIQIAPAWPRGYSRKGTAQCYKGAYAKAKETFTQGLEKIPNEASLQQGLKDVLTAEEENRNNMLGSVFGQMFQGDFWSRLRADPSTRPLLDDPAFVSLLNGISKQPGLITNYLQDPRMSKVLGVLMGLKRGKDDDDDEQDSPKREPPKSSSTTNSKPSASTSTTSTSKPAAQEPAPTPAQPQEEVPENKKLALAEKEKGNKAYSQKNFEEAIKHYQAAIEADKEDMVYHNNLGAVYFEMGRYADCIKSCEEAVNTGRYNFADFKLISKAYHRMGNAYAKLEKYEDAIKAYNSALTEHRNPDSLSALGRVEKLKQKQDIEAYIDPKIAEEEKEKGNEAFKNGDNSEAIKRYSEAIKRDPKNPVYYSNRAAAYTRVAEYKLGEADCDKCLELDPKFVKAYSRKGTCQYFMKQYHKCLETYDKGLKLDPENTELVEGINRTLDAINKQQSGERDEASVKKVIQNDPELQEILADPAIQQILAAMQRDPKTASHYLRDPLVSAKINKLIHAGVLQVK